MAVCVAGTSAATLGGELSGCPELLRAANPQLWWEDYLPQTRQSPGAGEDFPGFWPPKVTWLFALNYGKGDNPYCIRAGIAY